MFRSILMGVVMLGAFLISSIAGATEVDSKVLRDSAAALQTSNPQLAASLSKIANEEVNDKESKIEDALEGKAEKDREEHDRQFVKVLQDAAIALQSSHPELAKRLTQYVKDEMNDKEKDEEDNEGPRS